MNSALLLRPTSLVKHSAPRAQGAPSRLLVPAGINAFMSHLVLPCFLHEGEVTGMHTGTVQAFGLFNPNFWNPGQKKQSKAKLPQSAKCSCQPSGIVFQTTWTADFLNPLSFLVLSISTFFKSLPNCSTINYLCWSPNISYKPSFLLSFVSTYHTRSSMHRSSPHY